MATAPKAKKIRGTSTPSSKKTTAKKAAPARKTTKKQSVSKARPVTKKKLINTKSATATSRTKRQPKKTHSSQTVSAIKQSTALLVLSPLRFPLNVDLLAQQTARYGGLSLVIVGALFSVYFAAQLFAPSAVFTALSQTGAMATVVDTSLPEVQYGDTVQAFQFQSLPITGSQSSVTISLDGVPEKTELKAKNVRTGVVTSLTRAYTANNKQFTYTFNPGDLPDGTYRFFTVSEYAMPDLRLYLMTTTDEVDRSVEHQTVTTSAELDVQDSSVPFKVDTTATGLLYVSVPLQAQPAAARLLATSLSSGQELRLGQMQRAASGDWEISISNTLLVEAEYRLSAVVTYKRSDGTEYSVLVTDTKTISQNTNTSQSTTSADNITTTAATNDTTTVETDVEKATEPAYSIATAAEIAGTARVRLVAPDTKWISVQLRDSAGTQTPIGYAVRVTEPNWEFRFDTTKFKDGAYVLEAKIHTSSGSQKLVTTNTRIKNALVLADPVTTQKTSTTTSKTVTPETVEPTVVLQPTKNLWSGTVDLTLVADTATYIEVYAKSVARGVQQYLGAPKQQSLGLWTLAVDSTSVPNGDYQLTANVRTQYGFFVKNIGTVSIKNIAPEPTPTEVEKITSINELAATLPPELLRPSVDTTPADTGDTSTTTPETLALLLRERQLEITKALDAYAVALRLGDIDAIKAAEDRLTKLRTGIQLLAQDTGEAIQTSEVEAEFNRLRVRVREQIDATNALLVERVGAAAQMDSDGDGITDFDEVALYKTNPNSADTDGDGFIDGAEVLGGFDPTDSTPEVAVVFESPKETGLVRDDVLQVHDIIAESSFATSSSPTPVAIITGKALPNSFVTLYIFSTPIIVTVRTEADGSWQYRFDRELEDGEHVVYAGITDNAGKIIAKSTPFTFVKEAQAFTPTESYVPEGVMVSTDEDTLSANAMLLLIGSISIVSIGLVLILLGFYSDNRRLVLKDTSQPLGSV